MSDVKWIKISTNIFDDEKIKLIETLPDSDTLIIIWFKLLSMAGRCNDSGMIYLTRDVPYNEEMLSTIMRRPVNTVRLAMNEFQKLGMIHIVNNYIAILNWEKHQTLDKYEIVKEQNRKRKQIQREKLKEITHNPNVTGHSRDVTQEIRLDKIRQDKNKEGRFTPPTPAEVQSYLDEIGNHTINRDSFIDHYKSKGWMIGKNKMKDWRAAVRTWARRDKESGQDKKGWPML